MGASVVFLCTDNLHITFSTVLIIDFHVIYLNSGLFYREKLSNEVYLSIGILRNYDVTSVPLQYILGCPLRVAARIQIKRTHKIKKAIGEIDEVLNSIVQ